MEDVPCNDVTVSVPTHSEPSGHASKSTAATNKSVSSISKGVQTRLESYIQVSIPQKGQRKCRLDHQTTCSILHEEATGERSWQLPLIKSNPPTFVFIVTDANKAVSIITMRCNRVSEVVHRMRRCKA